MSRVLTVVLAGAALLLLLDYGLSQRRLGEMVEQERALRVRLTGASRRADSLEAGYRRAVARADTSESRARAAVARRDRVVVATDSAIARADLVLPSLPDTARSVFADLLSSVRAERLASDSAIAGLSATLALKDAAIVASDSAIAQLHRQIAVQDSVMRILDRQAHPGFLRRVRSFAGHAAVGAGVVLLLVLL